MLRHYQVEHIRKLNELHPEFQPPCAQPFNRLSQDQYRCATCGVVWDTDEARPPCQTRDEEEPST